MTMVGRCLPVIRGLIAYPAGIAKMRLSTFIFFTTLGSAIWSALFVFIGYTLGDNLEVINGWMHEFSLVVGLLLVAAIAWHFRRHLHKLRPRPRTKAE
jgi:membrane protein DedA with SNARE-associated domain